MLEIKINDQKLNSEDTKTILEAALDNGVYIPHLCFYPGIGKVGDLESRSKVYWGEKEWMGEPRVQPDLPHLCVVEIKGAKGIINACSTFVRDGMEIYTETDAVREERRRRLEELLEYHPHACLSCNLAEGCDRKICSMGTPEVARCCWKFGNCEFQKIASYIGFDGSIKYKHSEIPVLDDNPLFIRDYNLCVGCLRCVLACKEVAGREAIGFVVADRKTIVGTTAPNLKESGCKFCLVCVEVCPTGALKDKKPEKKKSTIRAGIDNPILPPERNGKRMPLSVDTLKAVPESGGVYRLWDEDGNLYQITGTENLQLALGKELKSRGSRYEFDYEEDMMYTSRESQLIQQYLKKFGSLPPGNAEDDELF